MMDPYQVLGIAHNASQVEIKMAYRKLAKRLHPDFHPEDIHASEKFKDISRAYHILGDRAMRRKYDCGEIDALGNKSAQKKENYRSPNLDPSTRKRSNSFEAFNLRKFGSGNIFSPFFNARHKDYNGEKKNQGSNRLYSMQITFFESVKGGSRRLTLSGNRTVDVIIPAGIETGQSVRLKGQGKPSKLGGPNGDALIEIRVAPHPIFVRKGVDIFVNLPVTLSEAIIGGRVQVPTIDGPVTIRIPKGSNTGSKLRLKGKGILNGNTGRRGDQHLSILIVLPENIDSELEAFALGWRYANYNVRRNFRGEMDNNR